ncbi:MAG: xanthine dehydrogenase family protein molybdopterin-binding subunit [Ignavibacteria bacterium]|jgi:xanthine dehydrogenase YagR molybdenum-binding subunit|nr:xanthine dehydrogenase family protein molybdopterin-binding subunit [Ignavibacteria bacterium]MCU7503169.1 xanthine dehydrogenase family protein molybdopterin-binding subunit [Ignavibacteria bacterium]MCU7518047.1 xanthine dehydrogenase family protein molybdopterin-binding subunit [Ignavibacteria bacterium]
MARKIVKSRYYGDEGLIETMAEVPVDKLKAWGPDAELKVVGKPVSRLDGYEKVTGKAAFTFDVSLPRMTYAKILRSMVPHAKIRSIDTSEAEDLPGVLKILTHKNCPVIPWHWGTTVLFDTEVRYQGDEVACVVAESMQIAEDALSLIKVDYEILPFVSDPSEAMKAEAPKVHAWGNIIDGKPSLYSRGDVEKGFQDSDVIFEDTYSTQVVVHNPTEAHCSVVSWDGDKLTVWDSTQALFGVRDAIAKSLSMPASKVRVIKKFMGGGFGGKLEAGKYSVIAALISKEIGRPVRIALDRKEMNLSVGNRPDSVQKLKAGAKKDGTLLALSHYSFGNVGAYPNDADCSWPLRTLYKCPNVRTEEYSVLTNLGRARAYRAPGHVQGTFAFESMMDDLAEKLGLDPLELRRKNYTEIDPVSNRPYTSKLILDAYQKGSEAIGWKEKRKPAGSEKGRFRRGIGMASQIWWGGGGPPAYATIKLNEDASLHVMAGTQDLGTGTYTFLAQIASEVLELPIEKIQVTIGDTETCPYCSLSGGSMTAPSVSPAVRDASEQMKRKLISAAGAILETSESNVKYSAGKMSRLDDPAKIISISEVIEKLDEKMIVTTGAREANPEGYEINTFGAQFAEVEVDTDTGKVRVIKVVAAHDIGRVLNQKTLFNQLHGGIIQGIGYALMEERVVDTYTGKVLTTNIHDYKIPTIMETPQIEVIIVSSGDLLISNTGVKGVGEPAIIPTAAAIANAVYNATGVRIKSLPITADKVLMALSEKN